MPIQKMYHMLNRKAAEFICNKHTHSFTYSLTYSALHVYISSDILVIKIILVIVIVLFLNNHSSYYLVLVISITLVIVLVSFCRFILVIICPVRALGL